MAKTTPKLRAGLSIERIKSARAFNKCIFVIFGAGGRSAAARTLHVSPSTITRYATGEIPVPIRIWKILGSAAFSRSRLLESVGLGIGEILEQSIQTDAE